MAGRSPSPDGGRCDYFELEWREAYFTYVSFVILHASINAFVHFVVNTDVLMSDQIIMQLSDSVYGRPVINFFFFFKFENCFKWNLELEGWLWLTHYDWCGVRWQAGVIPCAGFGGRGS